MVGEDAFREDFVGIMGCGEGPHRKWRFWVGEGRNWDGEGSFHVFSDGLGRCGAGPHLGGSDTAIPYHHVLQESNERKMIVIIMSNPVRV